jgi:hypothetical protein
MEHKMSLEEDKYSKITLNKIFNVFNSVADTVIVSTKQIQAHIQQNRSAIELFSSLKSNLFVICAA